VHDAVDVRRVERLAHLPRDADGDLGPEPLRAAQPLAQRPPLDGAQAVVERGAGRP
jgi:hypothetical protein